MIRVVYEDAALYNVAYFIGDGPPIDESVEFCGVKLASTCITGTVDHHIPDNTQIPALSANMWSSPHAIARQLRAFFENHIEHLRGRIGSLVGSYEVRISLCADGAVAGLGWHKEGQSPRYNTGEHFPTLQRTDVLKVLGYEKNSTSSLVDVSDIAPEICNIKGALYVPVQTAGWGHRAGSGCHSMWAMRFSYR